MWHRAILSKQNVLQFAASSIERGKEFLFQFFFSRDFFLFIVLSSKCWIVGSWHWLTETERETSCVNSYRAHTCFAKKKTKQNETHECGNGTKVDRYTLQVVWMWIEWTINIKNAIAFTTYRIERKKHTRTERTEKRKNFLMHIVKCDWNKRELWKILTDPPSHLYVLFVSHLHFGKRTYFSLSSVISLASQCTCMFA